MFTPIDSIISNTRSWTPLLISPLETMRNIVECFRSYDAPAWNANLELLNGGIKLGMDMFLPALLLSIIGSLLQTSPTASELVPTRSSRLHQFIHVFSPYTLALSSSLPRSHPPFFAKQRPFVFDFDPRYFLRCVMLFAISPTTIDILLHNFAPLWIQILSRLRVVLSSRKHPDDSALEVLAERVRVGRALRRHAYDLYFPPTNEIDCRRDYIPSLLFFPGFGVHHSAYADVASRISDYGILVAVVSLEPLRLAHKNLGGGLDDVRHLIQLAGEDMVVHRKRSHPDMKINIEWALGGHSMGGYDALQLAECLKANTQNMHLILQDGSISRLGTKIIPWAAGTIAQGFPDLHNTSSLRVCILLASNDSIASISSPQQKREILLKLPKGTRFYTINGGNHSGFASYENASKESGTTIVNGPRNISLEAQQKEASLLTARFLLR